MPQISNKIIESIFGRDKQRDTPQKSEQPDFSHLASDALGDSIVSRLLTEIGLIGEKFGPDARRFDIERAAVFIDSFLSADYCRQHMPFAHPCETKEGFLRHAMKRCPLPTGQILEFGVFSGTTIRWIAETFPESLVVGFDTFEGLPADWHTRIKKGSFDHAGKAPLNLPANVRLVQGLFDDTLPDFVAQNKEPLRLLHIDSDLYESARSVFTHVKHLIVPGTVIVFDEYFNYLGWQRGEFKAFQEVVRELKIDYEYIGYTRYSESVSLRVNKIG